MMTPMRGRARQGGFILLVAMVILFALASMVISLCRSGQAELLASANQTAQFEAAAAERGGEQYVLSILTDNFDGLADMTEEEFARIPCGRGFFWVLRPDYLDADLPEFGLVDESTKLNLNTADVDQLMALPGMTQDIAESIIDWRDPDDLPTGNGAESSVYLGQSPAYAARNADFETVEELSLVRGVTRQMLSGELGTGAASAQTSQAGSDAVFLNGWKEFLTVVSSEPGQNNGPAVRGRINVNQAPAAILRTLSPDLADPDIDRLLAARRTAIIDDPTDTSWVQQTLANKYTNAVAQRITGQGRQFSADIVAASGDGRAFKRVRIIVDTTVTPIQIIYRRDLTEAGFPMDPAILQQLRQGGASIAMQRPAVMTGAGA